MLSGLSAVGVAAAASFTAYFYFGAVSPGSGAGAPAVSRSEQLPRFSLIDVNREPFGSAELAGEPYVVNFIFTRCSAICPVLTAAMARLHDRYEAEGIAGVRLVSITVDPEYDSPEVLRAYGEARGVDFDRWTFLTGERGAITELVIGGFKTAIGDPTETPGGLIDIAHSGKFVLVDGSGRVRGYYDSHESGLNEIFQASRLLLTEK